MFLSQTDLEQHIKADNLLAMAGFSTGTIEGACSAAIAQAKEYLFQRYDTDAIFGATGAARNQHLVTCCSYIALYQLHLRLPKRMIPELIQKNYDDTLTYLERVADAKQAMDAPRRVDAESVAKRRFRFGSDEPRT
jgi:phage gp36-like protein